MKTLYIECKMGAAGDMLMGALYDILDESGKKEFLGRMNSIFGETVRIEAAAGQKCSISGSHMHVIVLGTEEMPREDGDHMHEHAHDHGHEHHHHHHYSYAEVLGKIDSLDLPSAVRADASAIYRLIGEAEAKVHDSTLENIHFHEVGSLDAVADVTGCCLALNLLGIEKILCSPIHVGNGTVRCAHGILPVPAPATAEILKDVPYYTGNIDSELCTPTGAAILKHFAAGFGDMPVMTVEKSVSDSAIKISNEPTSSASSSEIPQIRKKTISFQSFHAASTT